MVSSRRCQECEVFFSISRVCTRTNRQRMSRLGPGNCSSVAFNCADEDSGAVQGATCNRRARKISLLHHASPFRLRVPGQLHGLYLPTEPLQRFSASDRRVDPYRPDMHFQRVQRVLGAFRRS